MNEIKNENVKEELEKALVITEVFSDINPREFEDYDETYTKLGYSPDDYEFQKILAYWGIFFKFDIELNLSEKEYRFKKIEFLKSNKIDTNLDIDFDNEDELINLLENPKNFIDNINDNKLFEEIKNLNTFLNCINEGFFEIDYYISFKGKYISFEFGHNDFYGDWQFDEIFFFGHEDELGLNKNIIELEFYLKDLIGDWEETLLSFQKDKIRLERLSELDNILSLINIIREGNVSNNEINFNGNHFSCIFVNKKIDYQIKDFKDNNDRKCETLFENLNEFEKFIYHKKYEYR